MRYHHQAPSIYLGLYGRRYICDHPVYNSCTLFEIGEKGLAVIQQRYDAEIKSTWWSEIDPWLTDELYLHPGFKEFFDLRANKPKDGLYPTVTIRLLVCGSLGVALENDATALVLFGMIAVPLFFAKENWIC